MEQRRKFVVHTAVITVGLVEVEATPRIEGGTDLVGRVMQHDNRYHAFLLEVPEAMEVLDEEQRNSLAKMAAETLVEMVFRTQSGEAQPPLPSAPVIGFTNGGLLGGGEGSGSA